MAFPGLARVRSVPPPVWVAAAAAVGLLFLVWHQYASDDTDTDWTTPKETQPPDVVGLSPTDPPVPPTHGAGRPMECTPGVRAVSYPATLEESPLSWIGGAC